MSTKSLNQSFDIEIAKVKAAETYNAAADYFDHPVSSFWHRFGRETVARLNLQPGQNILDVCCGSGGSALPAAELVGSSGSVIAVDLAEKLLYLGREKAKEYGYKNIRFQVADMMNLPYSEEQFDAVICVFGIFFVPNMEEAVQKLWRLVRPSGRLAITTWGPRLFEPASSHFWESIARIRPDLKRHFNPWDRIDHRDSLLKLLKATGIENPTIDVSLGTHPMHTPDDWWMIAMGSGYRGTIDLLDAEELATVREQNLIRLRSAQICEIETNVIYSVSTKAI